MLVPDARFLVPIPDALDPVAAAPLTDAGLTPYHAVKLSVAKMVPGSAWSSSARAAWATWASRSSRP